MRRRPRRLNGSFAEACLMFRGYRIGLIIPALNEEEAVGPLLDKVDRSIVDWIIIADNGSIDRTAERALRGGAIVVEEPRRGYGSACLSAMLQAPDADVLVFMDGDGSDDPSEIEGMRADGIPTTAASRR